MNRANASFELLGASRPASNSGTAAKTAVTAAATANLVTTTDPRRTGVASRWMALPSSISAPSSPVPTISAVSGSSTEKPKSPSTWSGQDAFCAGCDARSTSVSAMRITAGLANSTCRLRPSVARTVMDAITALNSANIDCSAPLIRFVRDEVAEAAFQRLVGGQQLAERDGVVAAQPRDLGAVS